MNRKKKYVRITTIVISVVMVIGTLAALSRTIPKKKKNVVKSEVEKVDRMSEEEVNRNMEKADINVEGDVVKGTVVLDKNINKQDADKIADELAKKLKEENEGKDVSVKVVIGDEAVAGADIEKVKNPENEGKPEATIKVEAGISPQDRYVAVTLDTETPEKFQVAVLGQVLKYEPKINAYHGVIESTDEQEIKKGVLIFPSTKTS